MMEIFDSPAIPPPVSVELFDTNTTVYDELEVDDMKARYSVEDGNEFNVICTSSGTFSGRVTWINEGANLVEWLQFSNCTLCYVFRWDSRSGSAF